MRKEEKLQVMQDNPSDKRHGTRNGYQIGCRCARCVAANRRYKTRRRDRENLLKALSKERCLKQMQEDPTDKRHGTATGYNYGCRCEKCLMVGRLYYLRSARLERKERHDR